MRSISHIGIGLLSVAFALPLVFLGMYSLARTWTYPDMLPSEWSFEFWFGLMRPNSALTSGFGISLLVAAFTAVVSTGLALPVSKTISEHPRRRMWLFMAYFPFVLAPVVYATTLRIFFVRMGLAGSVPGIMLGHILIAFPFAVLVLEAGWNVRIRNMADQARTLGANSWQVYWRVIVPAFRSVLVVCLFQTFLISWYEYGLTSLLGLGQIKTLPVQVYQFIQEASPSFAALAACLLMLPPVILLMLNRKWLLRPQV